jgi:hypothetical protein
MPKKAVGYVVKFKPKYKNSGYAAFTNSPASSNVTWTKARAKKEMDFTKKNYGMGKSGLKVKDTHTGRVVKVSKKK